MTVAGLAAEINRDWASVRRALMTMPDAYIDRYVKVQINPHLFKYAAVWCVVIPPPNCPKPTDK